MELTNCFSLCCTLSAVVRFPCAAVLSLFERNLLDYPKKKKKKITRQTKLQDQWKLMKISVD